MIVFFYFIATTVLHCDLNLSQDTAPYTVDISIKCNREATTNCSIDDLPSHQCKSFLSVLNDNDLYTLLLFWAYSIDP